MPVLVRHIAVQSVIETCLTLTHDVVPSCHFTTTCLPFVSGLVQASSGMGVPLDDRVDIARLLDVTGLGYGSLDGRRVALIMRPRRCAVSLLVDIWSSDQTGGGLALNVL